MTDLFHGKNYKFKIVVFWHSDCIVSLLFSGPAIDDFSGLLVFFCVAQAHVVNEPFNGGFDTSTCVLFYYIP